MTGHVLHITGEPGWNINAKVTCHEPDGANCRLFCSDRDCESWATDGTHEHPLESRACLAVQYFDDADPAECFEGFSGTPLSDGIAVNVRWDGDGWLWTNKEEAQS